MKLKLLIGLLLISSVSFAGRRNEVQLDLLGSVYNKFWVPTHSLNTNSFSVSFERIGAFGPRWSGLVNVQCGQMPSWAQTLTSSGIVTDAITYRGGGLQLAARFYPAKSSSKRFGLGHGFFIGPYVSYLFLAQRYYERINSGNWEGLALLNNTRGSTYAIGLHAGYKFLIKNRVTITPSVWMSVGDFNGFVNGLPFYYSSPNPSLPERNNQFSQLSVGYRF